MNASGQVTVALGEYDIGWHDPAKSIADAGRLAERAAGMGASLIALPETATTGFTLDPSRAVTIDSADVDSLKKIAIKNSIWVIAGIALRVGESMTPSDTVNAALAIDSDGSIAGVYHKQRLCTFCDEDKSYRAGNHPTIVNIGGLRVAMFVCYDLRFPEVFGVAARDSDAMFLLANWPTARRQHWNVLLQARAIENQCYMVGISRTGVADGLTFFGGSIAYDAWGDRVPTAQTNAMQLVTLRASHPREIRERYPFLRDRQV